MNIADRLLFTMCLLSTLFATVVTANEGPSLFELNFIESCLEPTGQNINHSLLSADERSWLATKKEIQVGMMSHWPPISYVNNSGKTAGVSPIIIDALNRVLDNRIKLVPGHWNVLLQQLKAGEIDAIMDFTPTPQRKGDFIYTLAYLNIPHVIVSAKWRHDISREADLRDKKLALEKSFGNVEYFQQLYPHATLLQYPDTESALKAVNDGVAEAYPGNLAVVRHVTASAQLENLKTFGILKKPGSVLSIGLRKDLTVLHQILDKSLGAILRDHKTCQYPFAGDENWNNNFR